MSLAPWGENEALCMPVRTSQQIIFHWENLGHGAWTPHANCTWLQQHSKSLMWQGHRELLNSQACLYLSDIDVLLNGSEMGHIRQWNFRPEKGEYGVSHFLNQRPTSLFFAYILCLRLKFSQWVYWHHCTLPLYRQCLSLLGFLSGGTCALNSITALGWLSHTRKMSWSEL